MSNGQQGSHDGVRVVLLNDHMFGGEAREIDTPYSVLSSQRGSLEAKEGTPNRWGMGGRSPGLPDAHCHPLPSSIQSYVAVTIPCSLLAAPLTPRCAQC